MPYTPAPMNDTYGVEKLSLLKEINTRPNTFVSKDEDYLNCYFDTIRDKQIEDKRNLLIKRPGSSVLKPAIDSNAVRGIFFWKDYNYIVYSIDNDVYFYNLVTTTTTTVNNVFTSTSGEVGFTEYLYDSVSPPAVLVATDGTKLVTINTSFTVTACTDPDLPTPHLPNPVFLDGFLVLVKTNTAEIYNSELNDPLTWDPSYVIVSEIEGDYVRRIEKSNNYLVSFGTSTIEFFWDAGIETGSPFQRNDTFVKNIGYVGGASKISNVIYFIGTANSQPAVYKLEDLKATKVSTSVVEKYLSTLDVSNVRGNIVSVQGKDFYVVHIGTYTYVLDIDLKVWIRWSWKTETNFPLQYCLNTETDIYRSVFCLPLEGSTLYIFDSALGTDDNVDINMSFTTDAFSFNTMRRKVMHKFAIVCDRPVSSTLVNISWSDDDYKHFNTPRKVELDQDIPSIWRLGSFRQRIFKFQYTGPSLIRLQEFEVEYDKGVT